MSKEAVAMILGLLDGDHSPAKINRVAKFMRDALLIGGVKKCRELINEAITKA